MPEFIPTHSGPDVLARVRPPLDEFTTAYLAAAEWLLPEPQSDDSEGPSTDDATGWAPEDLESARTDCAAFQADNAASLALAYDLDADGLVYTPERAGHDLWLTRNGHGVGFWDRGLGEVGDRLTEAAEALGNCDAYVGDDWLLYFQ